MDMRRVVVTGLGVISPVGIGKDAFWRSIRAGASGVTNVRAATSCSLLDRFTYDSQVIGEAGAFDSDALPEEIRGLDRFIQFAVAAALEAHHDAGLEASSTDPTRMGVALSTAICGTRQMESEFVKVTDYGHELIDPTKVGPDLYLASMSNTPSFILAALTGSRGPCLTISTGCIGGLDALGYAFEAIRYGEADVMISGATDAPITPVAIAAFDIIKCLSRSHNHRPESASRPFDAHRDGFVLAEGAGMLILEELEHAERRGAVPYAELTGFSATSNAVHMTDLLTDGEDLTRAIREALAEGQLTGTDIDYVNAHGSSTPQNDSCETKAIKEALGDHALVTPVSSTKSIVGHALAAAGALEMVVCALTLRDGFLHPTINHEEPDPSCDLDYVPNHGRPWTGDAILSNASGFSALHAAMVVQAPSGETV
jgi:3-oxoacyl-(acyl-carrier-protein) synthase